MYDRLSEDVYVKNTECEQELFKQRREEMENKVLHEADHKKVAERRKKK